MATWDAGLSQLPGVDGEGEGVDGEREGVDGEREGEDMIRFGTLKNPVFFLEHWGLFTLGFIHFTKTEVRDYFILLFFSLKG